jgi:2-methylisocitrate lyase-like PEP mutase family enzyme
VPLAELVACGVKRVSLGGALYRRAMAGLVEAASTLATGELGATVRPALPGSAIATLLTAPAGPASAR